MKPHLPGDFLLSLLRFSSSTTYLDPLSATTCFICISSQYLSHCPFRFFKHVFSTCLRTHRGQTMSHSSFCLEPQSKDVYLPCFGRKPWRLWNLEMESPTKISKSHLLISQKITLRVGNCAFPRVTWLNSDRAWTRTQVC